jgi:hypothetical protein
MLNRPLSGSHSGLNNHTGEALCRWYLKCKERESRANSSYCRRIRILASHVNVRRTIVIIIINYVVDWTILTTIASKCKAINRFWFGHYLKWLRKEWGFGGCGDWFILLKYGFFLLLHPNVWNSKMMMEEEFELHDEHDDPYSKRN